MNNQSSTSKSKNGRFLNSVNGALDNVDQLTQIGKRINTQLNFKKRAFRLLYRWALYAFALFSFSQSWAFVTVVADYFTFLQGYEYMLRIAITGGEGILLAWAWAPDEGLIGKKQVKYLETGTYWVLGVQMTEIIIGYGAIDIIYPIPEKIRMGLMVSTYGIIGAIALITAKFVWALEENRNAQIEYTDVRMIQTKNNAKLATRESREFLEAQNSLLDVERKVRVEEKREALAALNTKEAKEGIRQIGRHRAGSTIQGYGRRMKEYSNALINGRESGDGRGKPQDVEVTISKP